jgi:hypothetical protein
MTQDRLVHLPREDPLLLCLAFCNQQPSLLLSTPAAYIFTKSNMKEQLCVAQVRSVFLSFPELKGILCISEKVMVYHEHSSRARRKQLSSPFHPSFLGFIYILYGQYLQRLFGRHTTLLSLDGPPLSILATVYAAAVQAKWLELVYLYGNTSKGGEK